jgi:hypothetical protein
MNHYCDEWVQEWCDAHGWTDLFRERLEYWAFPPNAVMPLPIPLQALQLIKQEKGLSPDEQTWCLLALVLTTLSAASSYFFFSPMPLVAAFAFCAITAARLEVEEA